MTENPRADTAVPHDRWSARAVDVRPGLPYDEFASEYMAKELPVAIPDSVPRAACETWTPELFAEREGDRVLGGFSGDITFRQVAAACGDETRAPLYARNVPLSTLSPVFRDELQPTPTYVDTNNWLQHPAMRAIGFGRFDIDVFVGSPGATFPYLHWDALHVHSFIGVVAGVKEVALFAPDQTPHLYPTMTAAGTELRSAVTDPFDPDLDRFPDYAAARGTLATLGVGDLLFVPGGWWHTVRSQVPSISVVYEHANKHNWSALRSDLVKRFRRRSPLRPLSDGYLRLVERALDR